MILLSFSPIALTNDTVSMFVIKILNILKGVNNEGDNKITRKGSNKYYFVILHTYIYASLAVASFRKGFCKL